MYLEVEGRRGGGRVRRTWKRQVEEESMKVGLNREDALCSQNGVLALIRLLLG